MTRHGGSAFKEPCLGKSFSGYLIALLSVPPLGAGNPMFRAVIKELLPKEYQRVHLPRQGLGEGFLCSVTF